jgi:heme/copper-type cytochrome/quinol oxidase subunit 1
VTPRLVAAVHLAVVAAVVAIGIAAGVAIQLELWSPGALWTQVGYTRAFTIHGLSSFAIAAPALAGCAGYVAVARLVGRERVSVPALSWIGLALWLVGLGACVVLAW